MIYQLSVLGLCVASSLVFAIWWAIRHRDMPRNEVQTRFATRFSAATLVAGLAIAALMIFVPLPIGQWGYVAVGAALCAGLAGLLVWCEGRLKTLG
jgi:heme A synthase